MCEGGDVFAELRRKARERELAGDARAGRWVRDHVRQTHWQFLQREWRWMSAMSIVALIATAVVAVLMPNAYLSGVVTGAGVVATIGAMATLLVFLTGTASRSMGATAEQWTASELRKLRSAGWVAINHVALTAGDTDHILVGPGGIYAIETKWSANGWTLDSANERLERALTQIRKNCKRVTLWQPVRAAGAPEVKPVLFLWGREPQNPDARPTVPVELGGVTIIRSTAAANVWRESVRSDPSAHDGDAIERIWRGIEDHVRKRDDRDRSVAPPPPSLAHMYWTTLAIVIAGLTSFYLAVESLAPGS